MWYLDFFLSDIQDLFSKILPREAFHKRSQALQIYLISLFNKFSGSKMRNKFNKFSGSKIQINLFI